MNNWVRYLAGLALALLLARLAPGAWQANAGAWQALYFCQGGAAPTLSLPYGLVGALAGCREGYTPEQAGAYFGLGGLLVSAADPAEALARGAAAAWRLALVGEEARLNVAWAANPEDLALAQYAVTAQPGQAQAHFWLAELLVKAGDTLGAIAAYEAGLRLDPLAGIPWNRLGNLYAQQGDWQRAVQAQDRACLIGDQGKNGCPAAGGLYYQHGEYVLAEARYRQSLRQLPGWQPAQLGLAKALIAQDRLVEALPYLEKLADNGHHEARELIESLGRP